MQGGHRGRCPLAGRMEACWRRGGAAVARCLLSVLFLPGTPVSLNASTEALPTMHLSNASLAFRPGSFQSCVASPGRAVCVCATTNLFSFLMQSL